MVGCYGQVTHDDQAIDLTLDNELEHARWFTRSEVQHVLNHPEGTIIRRDEHKKFEASQAAEKKGDEEVSGALAPSEGAVAETEAGVADGGKREGEGVRFRVPPTTAIAGQLIKLWAEGGLEVTGVSQQKGRL